MGMMGIPEEGSSRMTREEKLVICIILSIGLILFVIAWTAYLRETPNRHEYYCKEPCCAWKTNNIVTSKTNMFLKGLGDGFKKGIEGGLDKEKK